MTPRKNAQGMGFGMAIVKRLVDLLEGSIEVCFGLGKGSRFEVTLPLIFSGVISPAKHPAQAGKAPDTLKAVAIRNSAWRGNLLPKAFFVCS